jgi:hypothetical protein
MPSAVDRPQRAAPARERRQAFLTSADHHQTWTVDVTSQAVADLLLDRLYLPDVGPCHVGAARRVVRGWWASP